MNFAPFLAPFGTLWSFVLWQALSCTPTRETSSFYGELLE